MQSVQVSLYLLPDVLAALLGNAVSTGGGPTALNTAHVGLATALAGFTPTFDPATIVEADFAGYARKPVTWGTVGVDSDGRASLHGGSVLFSPTDDVTPNAIRGVVLYDALTAGAVLGVAEYADVIPLAKPDDDLTVVVTVSLPAGDSPDYGTSTAIY